MNADSPAPSQALSPGARRTSIAVVATGGTIAGAGTGGDGTPSAAYQSAVVSADALLRGVPALNRLAALRAAGLAVDRQEGRQTFYSAQVGALAPLVDWTREMEGFWQGRFDALETLLRRMDQ